MIRVIVVSAALVLGGCASRPYEVAKPEAFVFGASVAAVKERMVGQCSELTVREITPVSGPLAKESQRQIDCSGFRYAGKPRDIELVFQDDQLDLAWILFPEAEKQRMLDRFKRTYGEPDMVVDYGAIYTDINAAVRNNPTEVLFASERQARAMLEMLAGGQ